MGSISVTKLMLFALVAMMMILMYLIVKMSSAQDFAMERHTTLDKRRNVTPASNNLSVMRDQYILLERRHALKQAESVKLGIVAMVTCSPGFDFWLKHHLEYLKIELLVVRVEDCPSHKILLQKYGSRVHATYHNKDDIDIGDNYHSMMPRQNLTVTQGLDIAQKENVSFLFHIDADELLYVGPTPTLSVKNSRRRRRESATTTGEGRDGDTDDMDGGLDRWVLLRKHLMDVEQEYSSIHMNNYEAVYPRFNENDGSRCFRPNTKFIECGYQGKCTNYGNGKSAARIGSKGFRIKGSENSKIRFHGPHNFSGRIFKMANRRLAVLHFDSCTFEQYRNKFQLLANATEEEIKKIPFEFYKLSIWLLQECNEKSGAEDCVQKQRELYTRYKVRKWSNWRAQSLPFMG